jgi:hypothetical protein
LFAVDQTFPVCGVQGQRYRLGDLDLLLQLQGASTATNRPPQASPAPIIW